MQPYEELEQKLGEWCGNRDVVVCSSGTSALQLAIAAMNMPQGSQVIVPEFTMISCPRAVTMAGLKLIFTDCGEDLLIDVDKLTVQTQGRTSAIMPVHVYGRRCNMAAVINFAKTWDLMVIEDLAEAHGVKPHSKTDAACWSFYRNKIIAGEEGGAVAFKLSEHAESARQLRNMGFTKDHDFLHIPFGLNVRLSNANAELILRSLEQFSENLSNRKRVEKIYDRLIPQHWHMPQRDVPWVYDLNLQVPIAEDVVVDLNGNGIQARMAFKPMTRQPEYLSDGWDSTVAHQMSQRVLYLPIHPNMTEGGVRVNVYALIESVERTSVIRAGKIATGSMT